MRQRHSKIPNNSTLQKSFEHECVEILNIVLRIALRNTVLRSQTLSNVGESERIDLDNSCNFWNWYSPFNLIAPYIAKKKKVARLNRARICEA